MLPVFDANTAQGRAGVEATLTRLRASSSIDSRWHDIAAYWIDAVRRRGDAAVVDQMRRFTDPGFEADRIRVSEEEMAAAERALDPALEGAIARAIENVQTYQRHIRPHDPPPITIQGATLGLRWTPIQPVGLLAPGGSAVLFSTLIMLAVPALAAGVAADRISVISPPPTRLEDAPRSSDEREASESAEGGRGPSGGGDISPITLAVCRMLGISRVYRIGGAAAAAALALGTDRIAPVHFIAGPGHPVVQSAKLQLRGMVGTDGYYGASEIVTLADDAADPAKIAADLLAQAEHAPGQGFVISWSGGLIDRVIAEMKTQVERLSRRDAIEKALRETSCAVLAANEDQAVELAERFAAEHVNLAVRDPAALLGRLAHGGEFFLGQQTPVAAGDYYAGPSHTLPTGTTARFSSGVSVHTFLKRSGVVNYPRGMSPRAIDDIARMARAEGLEAHAASIRARGS